MEIAEKNIERIMEEAEQIDKEEANAGTLVKLDEELQDQKKMRAKVQEIVKTLKDTGKEKTNTTDKDSVNGKTRQGSHAIINCQVITDEKHGLIVSGEAVSQNNDLNQLTPQLEQAIEKLEEVYQREENQRFIHTPSSVGFFICSARKEGMVFIVAT